MLITSLIPRFHGYEIKSESGLGMRLANKLFSFLAFPNFGCPFAVTACKYSNMSLKSGGLQPPPYFGSLLEKQSPVHSYGMDHLQLPGNNPQISPNIETALLEWKAGL